MKSYLSKLGVLLFGAMFAVAACQDYDEDIRQVNTDLSSKIDAAVADLEKKMAKAEDLKDLQDKFNGVQDSIDEAVAALEAAYKAGDEALQDQIDAALEEATKTIMAIDAAYKAADEQIKADLALVEGRVSTLESLLDEVSKKADKTADDLAALAVELRAADAAIHTLIDELTKRVAANEGAIKDLQSELATVKTNLDNEVAAREALEKKHALDVADLLAKIEANQAAITAEVKAREELAATFAAYKEENDKKIAALEAADEELEKAIAKVAEDLEAAKAAFTEAIEELNKLYAGLRIDVDTLIARVQSLVYVPDYSDAKATVNYAFVKAGQDVTYIPAKSILRYKVNSTEEGVVEDLVAAYAADNTILSYDLEGVKVRANEGDATIEIVGVDVDEDGYLAVEVLCKDFLPAFYTNQFSYSAALVLAQAEKDNNVASEFTNFVPAKEADELSLAVKYTVGENTNTLYDGDVDLIGMTPYVQEQLISTTSTDKVQTSTSEAFVYVNADPTKLYTPEQLFEEYGYQVDLHKSSLVVSYSKDGKLDLPLTVVGLSWDDSMHLWNTSKFNVTNCDQIGTSREVSLVAYAEDEVDKYDARIGDYLEVVDSYFLGGQQVAVADKVVISKKLVNIDFEAVSYDWTLQKALDLRDANGNAYANDIFLKGVEYSNIYDLNPIFKSGNIQKTTVTLNGAAHHNFFFLSNIVAPEAGKAGTADVRIAKGYAFAAADAEKPNTYKVVWQTKLDENTDAIVTLNVTFGKYPETVVVESEVDLELNTSDNSFRGSDALIADAYTALTAEKAGFAEGAKANDILFAALTDAANVNDPANDVNIRLSVTNDVDNSWVVLYKSQIKDLTKATEPYTFTRQINTWFGVPFKFIVTGKPQLPEIHLVRSTEYAHATDEAGVYNVNLHADIDTTGVYTVSQSDLAFYLNVTGDVDPSQTVKFELLEGVADIKNPVTAVEPLDAPINNPLVGEVTAYLQKEQAILTWKDNGTQIKVKATLAAGEYVIDSAIIILNVVDPLTFTAEDITVDRKIKEDTVVKVYENFVLTSSVAAHKGKANLLDVTKDSFAEILADEYKTAYGAEIKVEKVSVYEKVGETEADKVIYDSSKYSWDETTGIITLKKDDANELINPIVAQIRVTFTHGVHATTPACPVSKDIFITFQQPK